MTYHDKLCRCLISINQSVPLFMRSSSQLAYLHPQQLPRLLRPNSQVFLISRSLPSFLYLRLPSLFQPCGPNEKPCGSAGCFPAMLPCPITGLSIHKGDLPDAPTVHKFVHVVQVCSFFSRAFLPSLAISPACCFELHLTIVLICFLFFPITICVSSSP